MTFQISSAMIINKTFKKEFENETHTFSSKYIKVK